ncbi:MAG TPA: hypothetical protein PKI68_01005 [Pontiellaceae bacterium]|nr:hypothetical protein [Pontiellaceae bacterium]
MNFQRQDLAGAIRTKSFFEPVPISMGPNWKKIWIRACAVVLLLIFAITLFAGCASQPKRHPFLRLDVQHTCREEIKFYFAQYRASEIDLQDLETLCLMCAEAEAEKTAGETQ